VKLHDQQRQKRMRHCHVAITFEAQPYRHAEKRKGNDQVTPPHSAASLIGS
jgi:hypothetical protein